jgi:short-subunit dehydrogenase
VNVLGFAAIASLAFNYFRKVGKGHLVGITSIAGLRGTPHTVAYSGSKSFDSVYMEGLRAIAAKEGKAITVTDIRPGFVDTAMAKGKVMWCASVEKAANQMMTAIRRKKKVVYVSKRWNIIAFLFHILPDWIYNKII